MNWEERALSAARARACSSPGSVSFSSGTADAGPSHTLGSRGGNAHSLSHLRLGRLNSLRLGVLSAKAGSTHAQASRGLTNARGPWTPARRSQHAERRRQRAPRRRAPRQAAHTPGKQDGAEFRAGSLRAAPPGPSALDVNADFTPMAQRPAEGARRREAGAEAAGRQRRDLRWASAAAREPECLP